MNRSQCKYIIVGGGLSGLVTAHKLYQDGVQDIVILEARDRIGGRILTSNHIDLGATWFQDHHQTLSKLIDHLGIPKFRQYNRGKSIFVYSSMAPAQYFENDPNTPSAYRIGGGSHALIGKLSEQLNDKIHLNQKVESIASSDDNRYQTNTCSFSRFRNCDGQYSYVDE